MKNKNRKQRGFSLIEVLVVMVIIAILAILTFPYLRKAKDAAEDGNAFASMKTVLAAQYSFYSQNARYAGLQELNESQQGTLGTNAGTTTLRRGNYTFVMSPVTPTEAELRLGFTIIATRPGYGTEPPQTLTLTERGHTNFIFD
ncbi:MAG TPA: type II secretion system protein [Pyrinomonadaceae bacterium]|nr:type II secretion system protein [Pyrinomonadaceae bacterium]